MDEASTGFISTIEDGKIIKDDNILMDMSSYDYITKRAPETVNTSLWHQAKMLKHDGLFEVLENKIYQVRSLDLANMTFIRTINNKWIIVDVLTVSETAEAAMKLFAENVELPDVHSIIITHSHIDHFGGIRGVTEYLGYVPHIIGPENFSDDSLTENVFTGNSIHRRSAYMYGLLIEPNEYGQVTAGLGTCIASGTSSFMDVTVTITEPIQSYIVDDLELTFLLTPDAEAPCELMFYIPSYQTMHTSEIINHTLHNLYTLRGSKVRDGLSWSKYIDKCIELFGETVEISLGSHHWPVKTNSKINNFWNKQRDIYRFIHDQAVRLGNNGYNMTQIANMVKLPDGLSNEWFNRGYYGSLSHNLKAQYQLYFGWFDGNPAHLDPLPDPLESKKYLDMMGGAKNILSRCKNFINDGDLRWSATLLNKVVMAQPNNKSAKNMLSEVYTKLGYAQENAVWRNFYLTAAVELKTGPIALQASSVATDILLDLQPEQIGDYLATMLDPTLTVDKNFKYLIKFTTGDNLYLELSNSCLHNRINYVPKFDIKTLNIDKNEFLSQVMNFVKSKQNKRNGSNSNTSVIEDIASTLKLHNPLFNIVIPN